MHGKELHKSLTTERKMQLYNLQPIIAVVAITTQNLYEAFN